MEQHVENARALRTVEQFIEELGVLRADARKRAGGGEQAIEQGGAHHISLAPSGLARREAEGFGAASR